MKSRKILEFCQKAQNLKNMKVMVIPIVDGALAKVHKDQEKRLGKMEIRGRTKIIQTTA